MSHSLSLSLRTNPIKLKFNCSASSLSLSFTLYRLTYLVSQLHEQQQQQRNKETCVKRVERVKRSSIKFTGQQVGITRQRQHPLCQLTLISFHAL